MPDTIVVPACLPRITTVQFRNSHKYAPRDESFWVALQVRLQREQLVASHLRDKGYEGFVPTFIRSSQTRNRKRFREAPLFPGYVFCRYREHSAARIVTTPGVIRILGHAGIPCVVKEHEIDAIKKVISSNVRYAPCSCPQVGDEARILNGPLAGIRGTLIDIKHGRRLVVRISLLQRAVAIELDANNVARSDNSVYA